MLTPWYVWPWLFGKDGLNKTKGKLIAQKNSDAHVVEIEVHGKNGFHVKTKRYNPAKKGAVTGDETYNSFFASLLEVQKNSSTLIFFVEQF